MMASIGEMPGCPSPPLAFGFKVLLTALRYSLLTSPDIDRKIKIACAIQDCATAYSTTNAATQASMLLPYQLIEWAHDVAKDSASPKAISSLMGALDGYTTSLRLERPDTVAICRRALETVEWALELPYSLPVHIESVELRDPASISLGWPTVPDQPARTDAQESIRPSYSSMTPEAVAGSLNWKLLNIEIPAAEICAAIPLLYPALPLQLDILLALQTYDEGRHSQQLLDALRRRDADDFTRANPSPRIWNNMRLGRSLVEAICIEQVLGEGYAIGTDLFLANAFEHNGYSDLAEIHASVHADEFMHASQGLKWFNHLAGDQAETIIHNLEPKFATSPPAEPWFREDLRVQAGFSRDQIDRQRELAKIVHL